MRILIAPDSFKGSLSAADVAKALATGWLQYRPNDTVERVPIADGGEGTVDVLVRAWGGAWPILRAGLGRTQRGRRSTLVSDAFSKTFTRPKWEIWFLRTSRRPNCR